MITQTIPLYPDRQDVTLTTYVLAASPELLNGKRRPAVLVCPGGAYLGCSDREAEPVALRFAAMGYHAFVLRYSTYHNGAWGAIPLGSDLPVNPNSVHPAPMRDIGRAFLAIRQGADAWLVDTDKIAICGFSAGAHNCAMYAVYWHDPLIYEHLGVPSAMLRPAAAVLGYGIHDYHLMFGQITDPMAQTLSDAAGIAFLGTKTPTPELLDAVSPARHVSPQTPPTFLWATAADELVPAENTTRMATALAQARIPFEIHIFESGAHGLSLADQSTADALLHIDADAAQWMALAQSWLKKRFALPLPALPAWLAAMESGHTESGHTESDHAMEISA
jgi:acetyl esterase/lipase